MSSQPTTAAAGRGKVASLPANLREEICRRLHDGQSAPQILPWLNAEPRARAVLDERWAGEPVTPQNLSEWRRGGYQAWLAQRERHTHLKEVVKWAVEEAKELSTEDMSEATIRTVAGGLLEAVEAAADPVVYMENVERLARINQGKRGLAIQELHLAEKKAARALKQQQLALEERRWQVRTVEQFIKWQSSPEARAIMESGKPRHVQASLLRELFFGPIEDEAGDDDGKEAA